MDILLIDQKVNNLEIFAKIANSYMQKYNCRLRLNKKNGQLEYVGDRSLISTILEESLSLFRPYN